MGKDGAACVAYPEAADGPGPPGGGKLAVACLGMVEQNTGSSTLPAAPTGFRQQPAAAVRSGEPLELVTVATGQRVLVHVNSSLPRALGVRRLTPRGGVLAGG